MMREQKSAMKDMESLAIKMNAFLCPFSKLSLCTFYSANLQKGQVFDIHTICFARMEWVANCSSFTRGL